MPRTGVGHHGAGRVHDGQGHGCALGVRQRLGIAVEQGEGLRRPSHAEGGHTEGAAQAHCRPGGVQASADDVTDGNRHAPVPEVDGVVPVAADVGAGIRTVVACLHDHPGRQAVDPEEVFLQAPGGGLLGF